MIDVYSLFLLLFSDFLNNTYNSFPLNVNLDVISLMLIFIEVLP